MYSLDQVFPDAHLDHVMWLSASFFSWTDFFTPSKRCIEKTLNTALLFSKHSGFALPIKSFNLAFLPIELFLGPKACILKTFLSLHLCHPCFLCLKCLFLSAYVMDPTRARFNNHLHQKNLICFQLHSALISLDNSVWSSSFSACELKRRICVFATVSK